MNNDKKLRIICACAGLSLTQHAQAYLCLRCHHKCGWTKRTNTIISTSPLMTNLSTCRYLEYLHCYLFYSDYTNEKGSYLHPISYFAPYFYTSPHYSGGVLCFYVGPPCFYPSVRPSVRSTYVRPSALRIRAIT